MTAFVTGPVSVAVPASSANLGPGFDALALALDVRDAFSAEVTSGGLRVDLDDDGASVPRDETNLVVRAMRAAFDALGAQPRGVRLSCTNRIPHGRGLGSSAAAIVGGIVLARALVDDGAARLGTAASLDLAARMEGHPDNVAAALLGGLTIAWQDDSAAHAIRLECSPSVHPVLLVPPFASATAHARGLLPAAVPHRDAAANAGRAALLVAALTTAPEQLLAATQDRLHQDFRESAMPQTLAMIRALRSADLPAVLSGAGPSVLALARNDAEVASARGVVLPGWEVLTPGVAATGAHLIA